MNTCISCVKRQYPSRTLKLSHIELCQYCRGGPDGKPGSCIPFYFCYHRHSMDRRPPPRARRTSINSHILYSFAARSTSDDYYDVVLLYCYIFLFVLSKSMFKIMFPERNTLRGANAPIAISALPR